MRQHYRLQTVFGDEGRRRNMRHIIPNKQMGNARKWRKGIGRKVGIDKEGGIVGQMADVGASRESTDTDRFKTPAQINSIKRGSTIKGILLKRHNTVAHH